MTAKQQFKKEIDEFLSRTGMSPTRFSIEAMGDRSFMHRLERGCSVRIDTAEKVRQFMKNWRPERPKRRQPIGVAA